MIIMSGREAQQRLATLRELLFFETTAAINLERANPHAVIPTTEEDVDRWIGNCLATKDLTIEGLHACICTFSPYVLSKIVDRFLLADKILHKAKGEQFLIEENDVHFLQQCLVRIPKKIRVGQHKEV
jgi:hypothetical protein